MNDPFFTKNKCDHCGQPFGAIRMASWFLDNSPICQKCDNKESEIKRRLRNMGIHDAMEGCGYIPNPDEIQVHALNAPANKKV